MNRLDDPPGLMKGRKPSFIGMNGIYHYVLTILKINKVFPSQKYLSYHFSLFLLMHVL